MSDEIPSQRFSRFGNKSNGRGLCYIIANFCSSVKCAWALEGYKIDVNKISQFFKTLGYNVLQEENLTREKFSVALTNIKNKLENASNDEDGGYDKLVVFILSHGSEDGIVMCQDEQGTSPEKTNDGKLVSIEVKDITSFFDHGNIPSLRGYPKCIFVQACRGPDHTDVAKPPEYSGKSGVPTTHFHDPIVEIDEEEGNDDIDDEDEEESIHYTFESPFKSQVPRPSSANMLVVYSCLPRKVCFVNRSDGSWFINTLIKSIERHYQSDHLLDIIVDVNKQMYEIEGSTTFGIYDVNHPQLRAAYEDGDYNKPFSVYAEHDGNFIGKVLYESDTFGSVTYGGILKKKPMRIDPNKHKIQCLESCNCGKKTIKCLTPEEFKNNANVIKNSTCQLFESEKIVGIGKISADTQKITHSIDREINLQDLTLNGYEEPRQKKVYFRYSELTKIDKDDLQRRKVFIAAIPNEANPSEVVNPPTYKPQIVGKLSKESNGLLVIDGTFSQQSIFECTFTKQFYLCGETQSSTRQTDDGHTVAAGAAASVGSASTSAAEQQAAKLVIRERDMACKLFENNEVLSENNKELSKENKDLSETNEELSKTNEELSKTNEELSEKLKLAELVNKVEDVQLNKEHNSENGKPA